MTLLSLILCGLIGWACSVQAQKRGRNPTYWFIGGLFFGIFALILLFLLPPLKKTRAPAAKTASSIDITPTLGLEALFPSQTSKLWYYLDEQSQQFGPMSFEALRRSWSEGKLKLHTFVWNEELDNWKQFNEVIRPL